MMSGTGKRVQAVRIDAGLSVGELADASGVPAGTIYRIENGRHKRPQMDTLRRLAGVLNVQVADLIRSDT